MRSSRIAAAVVALACCACSNQVEPGLDLSDGTGGSGGGGPSGPDSLTVVVMADGSELEGMTVALDASDGRIEVVSGSDGRALFEGFDLNRLTSLIAHKEGYLFLAVSAARAKDLLATSGEVPMLFAELVAPELITLSGKVTGMADTMNHLIVATATGFFVPWHHDIGPDFSVAAKKDTDVKLFAHEYTAGGVFVSPRGISFTNYGSVAVDVPASNRDQAVAVDLSTPDPYLTASGSFPLPGDPELFTTGQSNVLPYARVTSGVTGLTEVVDLSSGGQRFDFSVVYLDLPDVEQWTEYGVFTPGAFSVVRVDGPPQSGDLDFEMYSPPRVTTPSTPAPHPLHQPIEWTYEYGEAREMTIVSVGNGEQNVGLWLGTGEEISATIPELPSSADPMVVFQDIIRGRVYSCADDPKRGGICVKAAQQRNEFVLAP